MFSSSAFRQKRSWNIVVVEDDPLVLQVHAEMLKALGHNVSAFASPMTALGHVQGSTADVDLLITDYRMPQISGLDLVAQLRDSGCGFPTMILTGSVNDVDTGRARAYGAVLVTKPLPIQELDGHIRSLQRRGAQG